MPSLHDNMVELENTGNPVVLPDSAMRTIVSDPQVTPTLTDQLDKSVKTAVDAAATNPALYGVPQAIASPWGASSPRTTTWRRTKRISSAVGVDGEHQPLGQYLDGQCAAPDDGADLVQAADSRHRLLQDVDKSDRSPPALHLALHTPQVARLRNRLILAQRDRFRGSVGDAPWRTRPRRSRVRPGAVGTRGGLGRLERRGRCRGPSLERRSMLRCRLS